MRSNFVMFLHKQLSCADNVSGDIGERSAARERYRDGKLLCEDFEQSVDAFLTADGEREK